MEEARAIYALISCQGCVPGMVTIDELRYVVHESDQAVFEDVERDADQHVTVDAFLSSS